MEWWHYVTSCLAVLGAFACVIKVISKDRADTQARIDRLWAVVIKQEEMLQRRCDWNLAQCKKLMYDEKRNQLAERLHNESEAAVTVGDMLKQSDRIDKVVEENYPTKEVEQFLE